MPRVVLVTEGTLTYAAIRDIHALHGTRWVIDLRANPRRFRCHQPRWTADSSTGILAYLTPRGIRYCWSENMARILADRDRVYELPDSLEPEDFEHVQDFLRLLMTRKSNVLLVIPDGTNNLFDCWLASRLELIWHFDPMSVLSSSD